MISKTSRFDITMPAQLRLPELLLQLVDVQSCRQAPWLPRRQLPFDPFQHLLQQVA